jgi:hypothetical protein
LNPALALVLLQPTEVAVLHSRRLVPPLTQDGQMGWRLHQVVAAFVKGGVESFQPLLDL